MWELYLASCAAAFHNGIVDLHQLCLLYTSSGGERLANVIVAFSKLEDAKNIKRILVKNGFDVVAVCTSGAQTLAQTEELNGGILVCGYRLADMIYSELHDCLSAEFSMLMVSSPSKWTSQMPEDVVCLPMPLKVNDLPVSYTHLDVYKRQASSAPELFAQADIDGGLVGGASLKPDFGAIVNYKND